MRLILEILFELLKRGLRSSVLIAFLGLAACKGAGSASVARAPGGGPGGPNPIDVTVTLKSGAGFDCLALDQSVYCRKTGANDARLDIDSIEFVEYFSDADSDIERLEVWDDTVCVQTQVLDRPFDNTAGRATYCFGDASLGFNYSAYPIVYSPPFSDVTHGSPDVDYFTLPFSGGNHDMTVMTDEGGTWLVMTDSSSSVSEANLDCETDGVTLTCPNFEVTL